MTKKTFFIPLSHALISTPNFHFQSCIYLGRVIRVIVESAQNSDSLRHSALLTCRRFLWQIVSAVVIFKLKNC